MLGAGFSMRKAHDRLNILAKLQARGHKMIFLPQDHLLSKLFRNSAFEIISRNLGSGTIRVQSVMASRRMTASLKIDSFQEFQLDGKTFELVGKGTRGYVVKVLETISPENTK